MNRIPISIPDVEKYKKSAHEAIDSGWISNYGKFISLSENKLKELLNIKYCILMNNGTSATHCLFVALKLKYPHISKIYIPNGVFIAPWNVGLSEYPEEMFEVTKTNPKTLNMDTSEDYINSLEKNSAMMVVHNYGNIVNVPRLKRLRPDIVIVEDNCEGLFGKYEDVYSGTESLCSSCSFYANKTVFCGEGGAFFTNDDDIYEYIKTYYSHGMTKDRYIHDKIAKNYRMTNIQAGFLYDQLMDLDHILGEKEYIILKYSLAFANIKEVNFLKEEIKTNHSRWMFILLFDVPYEDFEKFMNAKNVEVRPLFYDIHKHAHLKNIGKSDNVNLNAQGAMLPSYPGLSEHELDRVISSVTEFFDGSE